MKTNTKIIMALGVLAAFMMVAVPFVAVSDDASAAIDDKIDGIAFDFKKETIEYGDDFGTLTVSDLVSEDFDVVYDDSSKTFFFSGELKKQDLSKNDKAFYKMWEENTDYLYGIPFTATFDKAGEVTLGITITGKANVTANGEEQFLLYLKGSDGTLKSYVLTFKETDGSVASYKFDVSKVKTEESVAKVTDKDGNLVAYYADFETAVGLATDGQTVTLLEDVIDVANEVKINSNIAIDLNKNKVSFNEGRFVVNGNLSLNNGCVEATAVKDDGFSVIKVAGEANKKASLTLEKVKIISAEAKSEGEHSGYGIFAAVYSTVTVNEGTKITADYAAIAGNGSTSGGNLGTDAEITINDGIFESRKATCIYFPNTSKLTVNGGTFTGASGFEIRAGDVSIDNAMINVNNNGTLGVADSGKSPLGVAFAIVCSDPYGENTDMNVTIGKDNVLNLDDRCFALYLGSAMFEAKYLTIDDISESAVVTGKESMTINYNLNESENFTIVQSSDKKMPSMLIDKDGKIVACSNSITGLSGTITLDTDKDVILSDLKGDITVKGKVGALMITGSEDKFVSIELESAETLCISNVNDVTVNGGKFESDSYVDANGGNSVVNISNVKETVSVKNVTIIAKGDVKGQGISIMNCDKVEQIVVSDNKIYNADHHSIMIGSVFEELETLDITNNTFSGWGCKVEYSSAIHMFGKADSSVKAAISNNTFTCKMEDSSRLGKIISIGYQNGYNDDDSMGAFKNPVLFTKNVVNGKATDDFNLVVEKGATTYVDFGTKYAGKAIGDTRQDGIGHKAISYGNFIIENGKMMDIGNNGSIVINGTVTCEGTIKTTATEKLDVKGKLVMKAGSTLTVVSSNVIGTGAFNITEGRLAISTNEDKGFDAVLYGTATSKDLDIWTKDTLTVDKGAELKMTGILKNAGKVIVDGKLILDGTNKLLMMNNGITTVNGIITGGEVDITNIAKGVKCITVNVNGVLNTTVDGTVKEGTKDIKSIVVLDNVIAGANGITVKKGSVIVDGIIKTGDVTIPAGSTSFVYGTLESGSKLKVEPGASVNTGGTGTLVIESGAEVEAEGAIVSVIYKAGSKLNDVAFEKDTKYTSDGEVKVSIKIYLNYDSNKLMVSAHYVDAFAGDKYGDLLSDVYVEGVNKRITFTGWYNTLNEKIVSGAIVPDVTEDIILSAHFDEVAKQIPAKVDSDNGNDVNDYSLVIAFVVLVASLGFLACVIKKR